MENKYLRRMFYFNGDELINPLFHLFHLSTVVWIVSMAFLGDHASVQACGLYQSLVDMSDEAVVWWGRIGLVVISLNFATVLLRKPWISKLVAFMGFLLWCFSCWAFALSGLWVHMLSIGLPHMLFWVWYYFETLRYESLVKSGMIVT